MDQSSAIAHIAAGLVLSLVEIQSVEEGCDWIGQVCGASEIIRALPQEQRLLHNGSDASLILGWVYHFDVFSRFSFRHWRTEMITSTALGLGFIPGSDGCALQYLIARASFSKNLPGISVHAHEIERLLAQVFDTILYSSDERYHSDEYQHTLDDLSAQLETTPLETDQENLSEDDSLILEVTRLAGLIYHERVSRNFSGSSSKLDAWRDRALSILVRLNICPSAFVLFIIGCELHSDAERLSVLELFTRLENAPHFKSLSVAKGLVQTAWTQHDLSTDGEFEYIHKINLVLSSRDAVPSFV
ncbi:hypothetical protein T440DRAFT_488014 [Plenodomus tracheiphilus IPT5]|uniref:Uncharacterized protein n=1 Tax=Plenodomus tracheiphilus IPT5 TaxID=1408161 RepID=A0A6A7BFQ3_9PLEO|nr:hypothetical protein T440DRAFT_488014 [Plenodomus tracheiphilus IPT5]